MMKYFHLLKNKREKIRKKSEKKTHQVILKKKSVLILVKILMFEVKIRCIH